MLRHAQLCVALLPKLRRKRNQNRMCGFHRGVPAGLRTRREDARGTVKP
jgi:hypothetical protein